jgi:hypothetical protein
MGKRWNTAFLRRMAWVLPEEAPLVPSVRAEAKRHTCIRANTGLAAELLYVPTTPPPRSVQFTSHTAHRCLAFAPSKIVVEWQAHHVHLSFGM